MKCTDLSGACGDGAVAGVQAPRTRSARASSERIGFQPTKRVLRRLNSRVYAVIVARAGSGAKSRLAGVLDLHARQRLVVAMLRDVLAACRASPELAHSLVVCDPPLARELQDGVVEPDPGGDAAPGLPGWHADVVPEPGGAAVPVRPDWLVADPGGD